MNNYNYPAIYTHLNHDSSTHSFSTHLKTVTLNTDPIMPSIHNASVEKNSQTVPSASILFCFAAQCWLEYIRQKNKASTVYKYVYLLQQHILPYWGDMEIRSITATEINQFSHNKLNGSETGRPLSKSYVRSMLLIIHGVLTYAAQEGWYQPSQIKIHKPIPDKKCVPILTKEQQLLLESTLKQASAPIGIGIMLALQTGLRIGEVCALRWEDIDRHNHILYVRSTISRIADPAATGKTILVTDAPKTRASIRSIPYTTSLENLLNTIPCTSASHFLLTDSTEFMSPRTLEYQYHVILKKSGLPSFTFHALRHTFATRCVEYGVDIKSLSEMLGHSNVSITLNTYVHSSVEMKRQQLEKMMSAMHDSTRLV